LPSFRAGAAPPALVLLDLDEPELSQPASAAVSARPTEKRTALRRHREVKGVMRVRR
jgi:hypothetical protein